MELCRKQKSVEYLIFLFLQNSHPLLWWLLFPLLTLSVWASWGHPKWFSTCLEGDPRDAELLFPFAFTLRLLWPHRPVLSCRSCFVCSRPWNQSYDEQQWAEVQVQFAGAAPEYWHSVVCCSPLRHVFDQCYRLAPSAYYTPHGSSSRIWTVNHSEVFFSCHCLPGHGLWKENLNKAVFETSFDTSPALAGFHVFWTMIIVLQVRCYFWYWCVFVKKSWVICQDIACFFQTISDDMT